MSSEERTTAGARSPVRTGGILRPRQLWLRFRTELAKRRGSGHRLEELTESLAGRDLLFRAPPLTPSLIAAVKAITPQFSLQCDEASRRVWELSQNGSSWAEFEALEPLFASFRAPRVLEIGPGMGRSAVFLNRRLGWPGSSFHLYEGDGAATRYPLNAPRSYRSFCGDLDSLRTVLDHNGLDGYRLFDALELDGSLEALPGPYDLVYSFYGVGFHWKLDDFWPEIRPLLADDGAAVFTVHHTFASFPELDLLPHTFVPFRRILGKDRPLRLLVINPDGARLPLLEAAAADAR